MDTRDLNHLINKYLDNTCSPEEADQLLTFFETTEGQKYLSGKIDEDIVELFNAHSHKRRNELPGRDFLQARQELNRQEQWQQEPALDSEHLFRSIEEQMAGDQGSVAGEISPRKSRNGWKGLSPFLRVAAILLIAFTGSFGYFQWSSLDVRQQQDVAATPTVYQTGEENQKRITLRDGTQVRMNYNSELHVTPDFLSDTREVSLEGEAYFDVTSNEEKPFIIHTGNASVEVLGTAFNVKSTANEEIEVAVVEGTVSVQDKEDATGDNVLILQKGDFGYTEQGILKTEDGAVDNYLSWMTGRLIFEEQSLKSVCTQLNRIYELNCSFSNEAQKELNLTTDISRDPEPDRVLSVISLSLDLDYRLQDGHVRWLDSVDEK